jgi:predicted AAA+ superfamily ATPase
MFICGIMNWMAHLRERFATPILKKMLSFWPIVGIIGPRQSGKSTLAAQLLPASSRSSHIFSLDDLELRDEAISSPKTFMSRLETPVVLDEIQKAPPLFDALKLSVDKKRIPGRYLITGSTSFSSRIGIRESLTGRIGLLTLHPMTFSELHRLPFEAIADLAQPLKNRAIRATIEQVVTTTLSGGMPTPAFARDAAQKELYWQSWLETTIYRDLAALFSRGYDADIAFSILTRIGAVLAEGELPTLRHFKLPAARLRRYLSAMEDIFLLRKIRCHELGIGKEVWLLMDSGLASHLMKKAGGEGYSLSLARHFLWNEWLSQAEYQGRRLERVYYKSAQGAPVDAILDDVPVRIVASVTAIHQRLSWEERALQGAMKRLGSKRGWLIAPIDRPVAPDRKTGIGILPWGAWS